jgi:hypothetical protein
VLGQVAIATCVCVTGESAVEKNSECQAMYFPRLVSGMLKLGFHSIRQSESAIGKRRCIHLFVNIVRWRIPKEKSKEQFEVWREMMDYQKSHPEKVYYTRSRFFTYTEKDSSEENWMFLDEYKRREDYDKWRKAVNEDPDLIELMETWFPKWDRLIVPGSRKGEIWNEVEKLRVEFE